MTGDRLAWTASNLTWPVRALLCMAVALAVYAPALRAYYIWDDDVWVVGNENLRSLDGLKQIWLNPTSNQEYYPLTNTVFWIEYQLWGLNPVGYHTTQVVLHGVVASLVWLLLTRLRVPGAGLAAAIFLVHPVGVETVAWVTEHKNTLSGICLLCATLAFVRAYRLDRAEDDPVSPVACDGGPVASDRANQAIGYRWIIGSALLYALAVLAKTVAVTLPGVLLVILWWKRGRITFRDVLSILPHLLIGLPLAGFAIWMQQTHTGATGVEFDLTWPQRLMVAGRVPWFYLDKLLWPWPLVFVYPKWELSPVYYAGLAASAALVAVLWIARHRLGRGPLAAVLIFGGMLLPASGFFNVYWHRYTYVADHVQYHASIAMIALFAVAAWRFIHAGAQRSAAPDAGPDNGSGAALRSAPAWMLVTVLGAVSFNQSKLYYDNERLMRFTARYNPEAQMPHDNLAHALFDKGRYDESIDEFLKSLQLSPAYPWRLSKAEYNVALAFERAGQPAKAVPHYQAAAKADPTYALAYYNLGNCLQQLGRHDEAVASYRRAIAIEPNHLYAWTNQGISLTALGRYDDAVVAFQNGLKLSPDFAPARAGLRRAEQLGGHPASR